MTAPDIEGRTAKVVQRPIQVVAESVHVELRRVNHDSDIVASRNLDSQSTAKVYTLGR